MVGVVFCLWVGCVGLCFGLLGVVGEGEVYFVGVWIYCVLFGLVYWCGVGDIGGQVGIQQYIGLIVKIGEVDVVYYVFVGCCNFGGEVCIVK